MDGPGVAVLVASGRDVYAGGYFITVTNTDGVAVKVNWIAKWDGSSWSALGSGVDQPVYALAVSGGDLYSGGGFKMAGGKVSAFVARAVVGEPDEDKDGVPDSLDHCPGTPPGAIVNADGCSLEQLVPCAGAWKNHGQYVSAVAHASEVFLKQGPITERQRDDIISAAARSSCGTTRGPRR